MAAKERTPAEEAMYRALQTIRSNDAAVRAIMERDAVAAGEMRNGDRTVPDAADSLAALGGIAWDRKKFASLPWDSDKNCRFCFGKHTIEGFCETQYKAVEVADQLLTKVAGGWDGGKAVVAAIVDGEDAEPCWNAIIAAAKRESDERRVLECIKATGLDPGKEWCRYCRRHVGRTRHWGGPQTCPVRTISSIIAAKLLVAPEKKQPAKKRPLEAMMEAFEEVCNKIGR